MKPNEQLHHHDDDDEEGAVDGEYSRLRRKLRIAETERRSFADEFDRNIRKQEREIDLLVKENEDISTGLQIVFCDQYCLRDDMHAQKMRDMISQIKEINRDAEYESRNIADLEILIKKITREIRITERDNAVQSGPDMDILMARRTRSLNNNKHEAVVKLNKQLAKNAKLRQDLDHQRVVKGKFDDTYKNLLKQLQHMASEYNKIIKIASNAHETRKTTISKIQAMETREREEVLQHSTTIQELVRLIGHNKKLRRFLTIKFENRTDFILLEEQKKNKGKNGIKECEVENNLIENYEAAFAQLRQMTDTRDIRMITKSFLQNEEDNFALFKYTNELADQERDIKCQITKVKKEIKELQEDDVMVESNRKVWLRELEDKGIKAGKEADVNEEKIAEVAKVLHELRDAVSSVFTNLACDATRLNAMLSAEDDISDRNVILYMGVIEQTTSELINAYHFMMIARREPVEEKRDLKGVKEVDVKRYKVIPVKRMAIAAPSLREDDVSWESDTNPLSVDDLRKYVNRKASQKSAPASSQQASAKY